MLPCVVGPMLTLVINLGPLNSSVPKSERNLIAPIVFSCYSGHRLVRQMIINVPKTEQRAGTWSPIFPVGLAGRTHLESSLEAPACEPTAGSRIDLMQSDPPCRANKCCRYCGSPLKMLRRIAGASFCSSEHETLARQQRGIQLVRLLGEASEPKPVRHGSFIVPEPILACQDHSARLPSGSLLLRKRALIPPSFIPAAASSRRMATAFSAEDFVVPADLRHRPHNREICRPSEGPSAGGNLGSNVSLSRDLLPEIVTEELNPAGARLRLIN